MGKHLLATLAVILLFAFGCAAHRTSKVPVPALPLPAAEPIEDDTLHIRIIYQKGNPPSLKVLVTPDPFEIKKGNKAAIDVDYITDDATFDLNVLIAKFVDVFNMPTMAFGTKLKEHNQFSFSFPKNQTQPTNPQTAVTEPAVNVHKSVKYQIAVTIDKVMEVNVDPHIVISY